MQVSLNAQTHCYGGKAVVMQSKVFTDMSASTPSNFYLRVFLALHSIYHIGSVIQGNTP